MFNPVNVNCNVDIVKLIAEMPSVLAKGVRCLVCLHGSARDDFCEKVDDLRLDAKRLERLVRAEEIRRLRKRSPDVENWLTRVDDFLQEVEVFEGTCFYKLPCLRDCSCWYTDMLERVTRLKSDRAGIIEDGDLLSDEPLEIEIPNPPLVGRDQTLSKIGDLVRDDNVTLIGIYGIPGVGKTSLLHKLYHEHRAAGVFDTVIYAEVSRDGNVPDLQRYIGRRLGLDIVTAPGNVSSAAPSQQTPPPQQASDVLHSALSGRNFILLLDDVWDRLDWRQIGIPSSQGVGVRRKIIFATPLRHVCELMPIEQTRCERVKLNLLSQDASWTLFCQRKGIDENDPDPAPIAPAKQVVESCGGLPRAVITVADALLDDISEDVCKEMVHHLKHSPTEIEGMEHHVLSPLRCAFNKLDPRMSRQLRQCLLYCSLFPEGHNIYIGQLIDYWVAEGLVGDNGNLFLDYARKDGRDNIKSLINDCFLESCTDEEKEVRLNDIIRGMALWITDGMPGADEHCDAGLFLTHARLARSATERWKGARRISCMGNGLKRFPSINIECPALWTVLFNSYGMHLNNYCPSEVRGDPKHLLGYAKNIKVLDLSGTKITTLPPEVGSLGELQYLNLSYTKITSLPIELNRLVKLKQLILRGTSELSAIPLECLPTPTMLQMFDLFASGYDWSGCDPKQHSDGTFLASLKKRFSNIVSRVSPTEKNKSSLQLEHLSGWYHLREVGLTITSTYVLQRMVSCEEFFDMWPGFVVFLHLDKLHDLNVHRMSSIFNRMDRLRELRISRSSGLEQLDIRGIPQKLEVLELCSIDSLSTVKAHCLQHLRDLHISECRALTELEWICPHPCSLPKLRKASFASLPGFCRTASHHPLSLPSLETLSVSQCPSFREISWEPTTAAKIEGDRIWWDNLEFVHDDAMKVSLERCFEEVQ